MFLIWVKKRSRMVPVYLTNKFIATNSGNISSNCHNYGVEQLQLEISIEFIPLSGESYNFII